MRRRKTVSTHPAHFKTDWDIPLLYLHYSPISKPENTYIINPRIFRHSEKSISYITTRLPQAYESDNKQAARHMLESLLKELYVWLLNHDIDRKTYNNEREFYRKSLLSFYDNRDKQAWLSDRLAEISTIPFLADTLDRIGSAPFSEKDLSTLIQRINRSGLEKHVQINLFYELKETLEKNIRKNPELAKLVRQVEDAISKKNFSEMPDFLVEKKEIRFYNQVSPVMETGYFSPSPMEESAYFSPEKQYPFPYGNAYEYEQDAYTSYPEYYSYPVSTSAPQQYDPRYDYEGYEYDEKYRVCREPYHPFTPTPEYVNYPVLPPQYQSLPYPYDPEYKQVYPAISNPVEQITGKGLVQIPQPGGRTPLADVTNHANKTHSAKQSPYTPTPISPPKSRDTSYQLFGSTQSSIGFSTLMNGVIPPSD